MKNKVFTLFALGMIIVPNVSNGMQTEQLKECQQKVQKITQEKQRASNLKIYENNSTAIGKDCHRGLLHKEHGDFWCNHLATMVHEQKSEEAIRKVAHLAFKKEYSRKDIDVFVSGLVNKNSST